MVSIHVQAIVLRTFCGHLEGLCLESVKVLVAQLCQPLWDPIDCSPPGTSVHGILQARILSGLSFPSPGDLPNPRIEPVYLVSPALARGFFTTSTAWEALHSSSR